MKQVHGEELWQVAETGCGPLVEEGSLGERKTTASSEVGGSGTNHEKLWGGS